MTSVSHYGIHWDADRVAWLLQGRGDTNAMALKVKSPFTVRLQSRNPHCNHVIPLAAPIPHDYHWATFMKVLDDPLVQPSACSESVDSSPTSERADCRRAPRSMRVGKALSFRLSCQ